MNSTFFTLMAEFNTGNIPLKSVCGKYFGMSERKASSKARLQQLPVPCYRGGTQKSEWLVSAEDLAAYIDECRDKAKNDWSKMNSAA